MTVSVSPWNAPLPLHHGKIPVLTATFKIPSKRTAPLHSYEQTPSPSLPVKKRVKTSNYLKNLLPGDLNATVASLRLLLGQLLPQDLEFLHQVPFVAWHRQALGLVRELAQGHHLLLLLVLLVLELVLPAASTHSCLRDPSIHPSIPCSLLKRSGFVPKLLSIYCDYAKNWGQ